MQRNSTDPYKCLEITVLKKSRSDEARELLERVAKQVQPIMRKRCWTVKRLSEFSPRNPNLLGLNVNRGAEVKIRLRPARDDDSFYDWNHILGTMLHELVHNQISPHNAAFYKLLDELWGEAEDLMDRGITGSGQGFDAPSAGRLGSHAFIPLHNPPEHKMGDVMRKAAEARARQQALMPKGPRKLGTAAGGSGINHKQLTPAQAAAAAAERRARDNMWCGAEHSADQVQQEVGQQGESLRTTNTAAGRQAAAAAAAAADGGSSRQPAAAAAAAAAAGPSRTAAAPPTGAAQQQHQGQQPLPPLNNTTTSTQQQRQQQLSTTHALPAPPAPVPVEQQLVLQQQWQQHLQQQVTQRQQRKRPAPDTVDLTMTDSEEGDEAAVGSGGGGMSGGGAAAVGTAFGPMQTCPCCAAAVEGEQLDAAVMQRLQGRKGYQQWCAAHRQALQQQQQQGGGSGGRSGDGSNSNSWVCQACTLINPGSVLACEACLTVKNVI